MADQVTIKDDVRQIVLKSEAHTLKIATIGLFEIPVGGGVVPEPFTPTTDPWVITKPIAPAGISISSPGAAPAAGTQLDCQRTDGALALPRLTTAQRDGLTPFAGMAIYNTTIGEPQIYDGTAWRKLDQNFEPFVTPLVPTGTSQTINFATGRNQTVDLGSATGDVTLTLSNPVAGTVYTIRAIQGATARDLIWPAAVLWPGGTPPVISTGDDDLDVVQLFYDGADYLGLFNQAFA